MVQARKKYGESGTFTSLRVGILSEHDRVKDEVNAIGRNEGTDNETMQVRETPEGGDRIQ